MERAVASHKKEQLRQHQRALKQQLSGLWEANTDDLNQHLGVVRYNETTRDLLVLEDGGKDPLSVFPAEIWPDIIKAVLPPELDFFLEKMKLLQRFTMVSTRWQRLIINEPGFWTQIDAYYSI